MKKAYAKVKAREEAAEVTAHGSPSGELAHISPDTAPATLELHPDRQAMLEKEEESRTKTLADESTRNTDGRPRQRGAKQSRYRKEMEAVAQRKAEVEAKHKAREAREKDRKATIKAKRPGKDGKVKLGRQGTVLLSRIRRLTEEGKI